MGKTSLSSQIHQQDFLSFSFLQARLLYTLLLYYPTYHYSYKKIKKNILKSCILMHDMSYNP